MSPIGLLAVGFIAGAAAAFAFALKIVDSAREQGRQQGHQEAHIVRRNALRLEGARFPRGA